MRYRAGDPVASGMPLGGIGTGKVEILPDGTLGNFTYQNNWTQPLMAAVHGGIPVDHRTGWHFGIWADAGDGAPVARLLQTVPVGTLLPGGAIPTVTDIAYEAAYPVARLAYEDPALPVAVTLEAFSPIIPGDSHASACPGGRFRFQVSNPTERPMAVALLAVGRNTTTRWVVGRTNQAVADDQLAGVRFTSSNPEPTDVMAGEVLLTVPKAVGEVTVQPQYNCKGLKHQLTPAAEQSPWWERFAREGRVPTEPATPFDAQPAAGEGYSPAGSLAVRFTLAPGESREIPVYLTWHMPRHPLGHQYENQFADALAVAQHLHRNGDALRQRVAAWQQAVRSVDLPEWLVDGLFNNLYVMTSGTRWTRDGRFATYEAPLACPLMETLDVRYYGSIPVAWFWPDLERSAMLQFAAAQRESGYVPHDLGRDRLDMPSDGTTAPPLWKDLATKFVLLAYRDSQWWADQAFLAQIYPHVVKALQWQFTTDRNGDGLPDNEGADQTYDVWEFYGTNAYTSSIYLAALRAGQEMARAMGDEAFAAQLQERFAAGRTAFSRQLWNGLYYNAAFDGKESYTSSIAGQLNGVWYADLLSLGDILPAVEVASSLESLLALNGKNSPYGVTNSVFPGQVRDLANAHASNIWPGESYALAATAVQRGRIAAGLAIAEKTWANCTTNVRNPFNQPDVVDPDDGSFGFGDTYMRNTVIWAVVFALAKHQKPVLAMLEQLKGALA